MKRPLTALALAAAITFCAAADTDPQPDNLDLSVDENLAVPAVPAKAKTYVKGAMDQLRRYLAKDGLTVVTMRDEEVLKVTVPCASLFAPCAVELSEAAAPVLAPLGIVVREPAKYKVLVTVHTDDTGDLQYADSITATRANAIDDYLWVMASERETNVIPYGIGRDEPVASNNSIQGRAANRRVEFIIIPDAELIRAATGSR